MSFDKGLDPSSNPDCIHGRMERRGARSAKTHRHWIGFFCPAGECPAVFGDIDRLTSQAIDAWKAGQPAVVVEDDDDKVPF